MATVIHPELLRDAEEEDSQNGPQVSIEEQLKNYVSENVVGKEMTFRGPFGRKQVIYCDWLSTGRALAFLEAFVLQEVTPAFSPYSSMSTVTSLQTTLYQDETTNIFRQATNASGEDDLMFVSHGAAGAARLLAEYLQLFAPVVFVGIQDDHSHWPWVKAGGEIVIIQETSSGQLDLEYLGEKLDFYHNSDRPLIGCFSAASKLTGVLQNDLAITAILHRYGALAFWDYTVVAPVGTIDMNPQVPDDSEGLFHKDAIFFSVENFVGGLNTPGVLIIKSALITTQARSKKTGGVVMLESSTTAIGEPIRAGLAMQMKQALGPIYIMEQQEMIAKQANEKLASCPCVILLGNKKLAHLATYSFVIRHPTTGLYLHQNFVCALLNDMFGIQSTCGHASESQYAKFLFGIDTEQYTSEILKPGYVRVDLPWFVCEEELHYILDAILLVATDCWKLLPQYIFNPDTGEWNHHSNLAFADRKWMSRISYQAGKFEFQQEPSDARHAFTHADTLLKAKDSIKNAKKVAQGIQMNNLTALFNDNDQKLRWFLLPTEAKSMMIKLRKFSGPICEDRLNIKQYASVQVHEGDDDTATNPVGTLQGKAIFPKGSKRKRSAQFVKRGYWLHKAQANARRESEVSCLSEEPGDISQKHDIEAESDDSNENKTAEETTKETIDETKEPNSEETVEEKPQENEDKNEEDKAEVKEKVEEEICEQEVKKEPVKTSWMARLLSKKQPDSNAHHGSSNGGYEPEQCDEVAEQTEVIPEDDSEVSDPQVIESEPEIPEVVAEDCVKVSEMDDSLRSEFEMTLLKNNQNSRNLDIIPEEETSENDVKDEKEQPVVEPTEPQPPQQPPKTLFARIFTKFSATNAIYKVSKQVSKSTEALVATKDEAQTETTATEEIEDTKDEEDVEEEEKCNNNNGTVMQSYVYGWDEHAASGPIPVA